MKNREENKESVKIQSMNGGKFVICAMKGARKKCIDLIEFELLLSLLLTRGRTTIEATTTTVVATKFMKAN